MAEVVALYRFPVKGFTQEECAELTVQDDGRIFGDRAFTLRYANALEPRLRDEHEVWSKSKGLSRMEYPSLAALRLTFDPGETSGIDRDTEIDSMADPDAGAARIRITGPDGLLVDTTLSTEGRERIASAVTDYLRHSPDAAMLDVPGRLPLHFLGDPGRSRFQDSMLGFASMHSRESLRALERGLGSPIDDHRFRSNIVIAGVDPWQEISEFSRIRIGSLDFAPREVITRCLNTHANPDTGERDTPVLTTLTRVIGQTRPTFGRFLLPINFGGTIRVGDAVEFVD